ncbi:MAG: polyprenyl synthetase family protein [Bryobacteraceae bacterium]
MTHPVPFSELPGDRKLVERQLQELLQPNPPSESAVSQAMRYAVLGSGQRIRPLLAIRIARLMGRTHHWHACMRAGASVELLHCASLIVDDLPCMDNELMRRNRPTVHVRFGEATGILAAFGLVALAARCITELDGSTAEKACCVEFQTHLLKVLDVGGLITGQSLDLALCGDERERSRTLMTELKTVPLFLLSVRAGLLFSDAPHGESEALLEFGRRFGTAYQMADDLMDGEQYDPAPVSAQLESARSCLRQFGSRSRGLEELVDYLHERAFQDNRSHR